MTELMETVSPTKKDSTPEDPKNKDPLKIRIHLLCDGTKNNSYNISEREKFETKQESKSDSYKKYGTGSDNSYDNGRTNIAIMEPHVEDGKDKNGYEIIVKIYVEGQGTQQLKKDDLTGYAFGSRLTGVYQRARDGINAALNKLQQELFINNPPEDFFIKQVDIDVFGFSRGAATARHAVHAMTTEESMTITSPDGMGAETIIITYPLFERFKQLGYIETRADHIKIKFAGLYDTVVSVNASQLAPAWMANNTRDQRAVAKAEFALHLAAADEHREDFPLHTIKSAKDAGKGAEYYLPGVHSDVGGSYNQANETLLNQNTKNARIREVKAMGDPDDMEALRGTIIEEQHLNPDDVIVENTEWVPRRGSAKAVTARLYIYRQIDDLEYSRPTDETDRVINRGRMIDLKEDMKNLIEDGWYKEKELTLDIDYLGTLARGLVYSNPWHAMSGRLIANRRKIQSAYSNIPLKIMVEHARKHQILVKSKLDQRADLTLEKAKLKDLENDIKKYVSKKGKTGSKPDDWLNIKTAKTHHENIQEVRNRHLHMSSRFDSPVKDFGFTPRIKNNLRRRFYYEG